MTSRFAILLGISAPAMAALAGLALAIYSCTVEATVLGGYDGAAGLGWSTALIDSVQR